MFLVVCSAIAGMACQGFPVAVDPRRSEPIAPESQRSPVLLSLTCEVTSSSATIACKPPVTSEPRASTGVSNGATVSYANFHASGLVRDTIAHTWQFTTRVQNLLGQSIGTLNDTGVTGVRVFVTDLRAMAGAGAVTAANSDGSDDLSVPGQSYFNYDEKVAPGRNSTNKLWKFNVPNSVTAVSMSILVTTDFPAEQNVTLGQPSTVPDWVRADTNIAISGAIGVRHARRVLKVFFKPSATLADRQLAIAYVNGIVIGGLRERNGSGYYVVQISNNGSDSAVVTARNRLAALPQVRLALPWSFLSAF